MITLEKLRIYEKYGGDVDGWACYASAEEKKTMSDDDWFEIVSILQGITLIKAGEASPEYTSVIRKAMLDRVQDLMVIEKLMELVREFKRK